LSSECWICSTLPKTSHTFKFRVIVLHPWYHRSPATDHLCLSSRSQKQAWPDKVQRLNCDWRWGFSLAPLQPIALNFVGWGYGSVGEGSYRWANVWRIRLCWLGSLTCVLRSGSPGAIGDIKQLGFVL
jgi:hypothetical protein